MGYVIAFGLLTLGVSVLAARRLRKGKEKPVPRATDEDVHALLQAVAAETADWKAFEASGRREFPLHQEGSEVRNEFFQLNLYCRPEVSQWPYIGTDLLPDQLWPAFVRSLIGKLPSTIGSHSASEFFQSLPPFCWNRTEGEPDYLSSGPLKISSGRRLASCPLERGDVALGLWPQFLSGLVGRKPCEIEEYRLEFRRSVHGPFRWVSEGGEAWLTNGRISFPRKRPNEGYWASYGLHEGEVAPGLWLEFLTGLEDKDPELSEYRAAFHQSVRGPFHWVKDEEGEVWLTNGLRSFQRKRPSGRAWKVLKLQAVEQRIWLTFLNLLKGKRLSGDYGKLMAQARRGEQAPLGEAQLEVHGVLRRCKLRKTRRGIEWIVIGDYVLFTVPRLSSRGTVYVVTAGCPTYIFASIDTAMDLASGLVRVDQLPPHHYRVDHHPGWEEELEMLLTNVHAKNLRVLIAVSGEHVNR